MEHGWLSTKYRANVMRTNIGGEWCVTEHTAANACLDELNRIYGAINILRNGPRILRAMNTVKAELIEEINETEERVFLYGSGNERTCIFVREWKRIGGER